MTTISVHAPQKMRTNEMLKTRNVAMILRWDFNANIGKEHSNKRVASRHTLHDITSEDGETCS
jgi:hypothetical protein